MSFHLPVLLDSTIDGLNIKPNGIYVDLTYGGGGHSKAILSKLKNGKLFAFDQDADTLSNKIEDNRLTFINQNFKYVKKFLKLYGVEKVDGVLGDLGVSSYHFDKSSRGFSTRFDGDLDMRMNQSQSHTAKNVVNDYGIKDLTLLFKKYGELKNASAISNSIDVFRSKKSISTTNDLKEAVKKNLPNHKSNKVLAKIFQAIRIEVNQELKALEEMLLQLIDIVKSGGRMIIISYHSLEDRIVKNFIKKGKIYGDIEKDIYGNYELPFIAINNKPITPQKDELKINSRSRSAKLRIAERI
ncbi:MAG: 16S rRNA (cytosine(1402)-N(4))-methyltransferase [Flavobacteriales bacterium]|mgnify:FL=1|nr:16S rRNA (cytosine(1402)-N(4))-methyltransferase [Flavobacteriales bacterium]|tara:strand:+ start:631 stop:1527 length:897 start_codon:yes stop_codon:yes gene_type:complete